MKRAGKGLLLAGLSAAGRRARTIRDMDVHGLLDDAVFFQDTDLALECRRGPPAEEPAAGGLDHGRAARSKQTLMGSASMPSEHAVLAGMLIEQAASRAANTCSAAAIRAIRCTS